MALAKAMSLALFFTVVTKTLRVGRVYDDAFHTLTIKMSVDIPLRYCW